MNKSSFIASALCVLPAMALFAMGVGADSARRVGGASKSFN